MPIINGSYVDDGSEADNAGSLKQSSDAHDLAVRQEKMRLKKADDAKRDLEYKARDKAERGTFKTRTRKGSIKGGQSKSKPVSTTGATLNRMPTQAVGLVNVSDYIPTLAERQAAEASSPKKKGRKRKVRKKRLAKGQRKPRGTQTRAKGSSSSLSNSRNHSSRNRTSQKSGTRSRRAVGSSRGSSSGTVRKSETDIIFPNGATLKMTVAEIKRVRKIASSRKWGQNLTRKIGILTATRVALNFQEQRDSSGTKWEGLSESTIRKRSKRGPQHRNTDVKKELEKKVTGLPRRAKKGESPSQFELRKSKAFKDLAPELYEQRHAPFSRRIAGTRKEGTVGKDSDGNAVFNHAPGTKMLKTGPAGQDGKRREVTAINMIPLIDSGSLFQALTIGSKKNDEEDKDTFSSTDNLHKHRSSNIPTFKVSSKGDIVISPKGLSKKNKMKMVVHNRPASAGKLGNVPGREFFFLKKDDVDFLQKALTAWILSSGDEVDIGKRTRAGGRGRMKAPLLDNSKNAQGARMDLRNAAAGSLTLSEGQNDDASLLQMLDDTTSTMLNSDGVLDFISASRGISMSTNRRIGKMRRSKGTK